MARLSLPRLCTTFKAFVKPDVEEPVVVEKKEPDTDAGDGIRRSYGSRWDEVGTGRRSPPAVPVAVAACSPSSSHSPQPSKPPCDSFAFFAGHGRLCPWQTGEKKGFFFCPWQTGSGRALQILAKSGNAPANSGPAGRAGGPPGGSVRGERANLKGLVLGCIEAKFCK